MFKSDCANGLLIAMILIAKVLSLQIYPHIDSEVHIIATLFGNLPKVT